MALRLVRRVGDASPWYFQLTESGEPFDLDAANADAVEIHMRQEGADSKKIDGKTGSFVETSEGRCKYEPDSADVDTAGKFFVEFKVTTSDNSGPYWFPLEEEDFNEVVLREGL